MHLNRATKSSAVGQDAEVMFARIAEKFLSFL